MASPFLTAPHFQTKPPLSPTSKRISGPTARFARIAAMRAKRLAA